MNGSHVHFYALLATKEWKIQQFSIACVDLAQSVSQPDEL
jgi:hypothetical protein